jgi:eukaryotic-like serine/threonine-protein kinase
VAELPIIEGLRVVEELGAGTLSSVYAALEEPLGRKVAVKVLRATIPSTSPFALQLEREAHVLSELCHPNIGLLLRFSKTDAGTFLVLEFVDGYSLAGLLKKKPTIPADSVAAIGAGVARGLEHAHDQKIVHRDIKPANVLVSRRGEVKIFDFGIAHRARTAQEPIAALSSVRVEDVATFGTPAYMSPEQILGEGLDGRSDVFSLGIVLYQLVCGSRPFDRGDGADGRPAAHRIRRDAPIPLHRRAPEVPAGLERIIMRAIEKLPADRFQSARAMAEELEELVGPNRGLRGDRLVMLALEHAGLGVVADTEPGTSRRVRSRGPVRRAVVGLGLLGCGAVAAGAALQLMSGTARDVAVPATLELAPRSAGFAHVLVRPWAEVWIDGQRVDVTPMDRAIPLAAGAHYFKFVHPTLPTQKRSVNIAPGQTVTIDVDLGLEDGRERGSRAERDKTR